MNKYHLKKRIPTAEEYLKVRGGAGMRVQNLEAAEKGLPNTLFSACVETEGGEVVGIGRLVGDGGLFYEIVDIAVIEAHQKKGLGKMIMDAVMEYIHTHAPSGAFVSLIADKGAAPFYERYGFVRRGIDEPGMGKLIH